MTSKMTRRLLPIILLAASLAPACSWASSSPFPDKYDYQIRRAATRWMPSVSWMLWKAQLYQESRLDPSARSPVGAEGLAQFMPATWADIAPRLGYGDAPRTAVGPAIDAGAYYMAQLRAAWKSDRPDLDRHYLAMASYNAGLGNIIKAQKRCGGAALYDDIIKCLPDVTGKNSRETMTYVTRIRAYWQRMEAGE